MTADEWAALQADRLADLIRTGGLVGFQALADFEFDYDLDQLFDFGLKVLLDGLAVTLGASGRMD